VQQVGQFIYYNFTCSTSVFIAYCLSFLLVFYTFGSVTALEHVLISDEEFTVAEDINIRLIDLGLSASFNTVDHSMLLLSACSHAAHLAHRQDTLRH